MMYKKYIFPRGFTLVELVICITIMGMLGVIALLYIRPYLWHTRNAARMSSVATVTSAISSYKMGAKSILALAHTGSEVTGAYIAGKMADNTYYKAGELSYDTLGMKEEGFIDPITGDIYPLGVTSRAGEKYEIAYVFEQDTGYSARVLGNWKPRGNHIISGSGVLGENTFTLSHYTDLNFFQTYDTVTGTGVQAESMIVKISQDGMTYTLDKTLTGTVTGVSLANRESTGLIASIDDSTIPVTSFNLDVPYEFTRN